MAHRLRSWPVTVYPKETEDFPEALAQIDVALRDLQRFGPSPEGWSIKPLGKKVANLWQMNLKVGKRQIRILYHPYNDIIVIFRIHKKSSPQEQQKAYELAVKRKKQYDSLLMNKQSGHDGFFTVH